MFKYIISLLILMPIHTIGSQPNNPYANTSVYRQILKAKPTIESEYALSLTKSIYEVARAFKLDPKKLTAILAQESGFKLDAINKKSKDYGISQINHKTIKHYRFNKKRLLTDLNYSVKAGAIVLSDFKRRYGNKEPKYWSRYNSSNPEKRQEYELLVARYL